MYFAVFSEILKYFAFYSGILMYFAFHSVILMYFTIYLKISKFNLNSNGSKANSRSNQGVQVFRFWLFSVSIRFV